MSCITTGLLQGHWKTLFQEAAGGRYTGHRGGHRALPVRTAAGSAAPEIHDRHNISYQSYNE